MQKDGHYYMTRAICDVLHIPSPDCDIIPWANQYTDELTDPAVYELRTQSDAIDDWRDHHTQASVIIPFHFVPGEHPDHPWAVTPNNWRVRELVRDADNPYRLGIALHAFQDSFAHQNFTGWREPFNSCYGWYHPASIVPNVGHAEMFRAPDILSCVWTDPRNGEVIDNRKRALEAARYTFELLADRYGALRSKWQEVEGDFLAAIETPNYDDRKQAFMDIGGKQRFSELREDKTAFIRAALQHLSLVCTMISGLWEGGETPP